MKKNVVYAALVMVSLIVSSCQKRVKNVAEKSETAVEVSEESVEHLIDPLDNAINEKCSRIKKVFSDMMDAYTASYYIISGHTKKRIEGSSRIWYERLKVITLPRELVVQEA